ncbi:HopJ type III effector protein [Pseudomonas sp. SWRI154]|nr:HopJ type III effector protein [Pseudomonas sp. SWRI154]
MPDLNTFRASLKSGEHVFADTLAFVADGYDYQPQAFNNGGVENAAGQNEGSCKTLGLALLESLSDEEALLAFGEHYRSVLSTPEGSDHANIRALMVHGLAGVRFEAQPLRASLIRFPWRGSLLPLGYEVAPSSQIQFA